jgi:large subunit ribosomal protein L30
VAPVAGAATPETSANAESAATAGPGGRRSAGRKAAAGGKTITLLQVRSGIGCPVRHKRVLKALGLRHPHHRVVRPDNPAVRGMALAVPHLVRIVEGADGA